MNWSLINCLAMSCLHPPHSVIAVAVEEAARHYRRLGLALSRAKAEHRRRNEMPEWRDAS